MASPLSYRKEGARLVVRKMAVGASVFLPGCDLHDYPVKVMRRVASELGVPVSTKLVHKHPEHGMSGALVTRLPPRNT